MKMLLNLRPTRILLRTDSTNRFFRCCSTDQSQTSSNQTVRVRFAPSPTGMFVEWKKYCCVVIWPKTFFIYRFSSFGRSSHGTIQLPIRSSTPRKIHSSNWRYWPNESGGWRSGELISEFRLGWNQTRWKCLAWRGFWSVRAKPKTRIV